MVTFELDNAKMYELKCTLSKLSTEFQQKEALRILSSASLPIRKAAKLKAKTVIKPNQGFTFNRRGTKYNILPGTIEKSIKVIKLRKASVAMIDVGYSTRGKYDGWFAHFVDDGTDIRTTRNPNKAYRGYIKPHNIMKEGEKGVPAAKQRIIKAIDRVVKKYNSKK